MSPSFTPTLFGNSGTRSRWYLASFLVTPGGSSSLARSPYAMAFACFTSAFAERLVLIGHRAFPGLISCWLARPAEVATARSASEHTRRSEERRVGKECRSRRGPAEGKKDTRREDGRHRRSVGRPPSGG